jgi:tetratricopeptide (TPR) repeat protein
MRTVFADFNAMTEAEHVRLNCRGSAEDLGRAGVRPGDSVWLSDGELVVGARVAVDPYYGLVGVPDWDTLVHLDDDESHDFPRLWAELQGFLLRQWPGQSLEQEQKIFRLLTIVEGAAPPEMRDVFPPGSLALRRAMALIFQGKPDLARLELEEARKVRPDDPEVDSFYLDALLRTDLEKAVEEADRLANRPGVSAEVLAGCINVLAAHADRLPDDGFQAIATQVLDLSLRFDQSPGRDRIRASALALVHFNRGQIFLRLGQVDQAHREFELAHSIGQVLPEIAEATTLRAYDQRARDLAARVRSRLIAA